MVQHKAFSDLMAGVDNKKTRLSKKILRRLDNLVKWIDENKDPEDLVLIASDHGFQVYQGKFFVNSWLKNKGYLITSKDGQALKEVVNRRQKKKGNMDISKLVIFVKKHPFLFKTLEPFYDMFVRYVPFDLVKQPKMDFEKSKAYCRSTFEGIIFFSNKIMGEEKIKLKKEILEELNKVDGIEAYDCDQFHAGKYRKELGEIAVTSAKFELDSTIGDKEFLLVKNNMHSMHGIFMAYGNGIKKRYEVKGANIYDVMPTILHLLNIPIPKDVDGKVLKDIFEDSSSLAKKEIEFVEQDRTAEEKNLLKSTIRNIKI